jgi:D-serine deaminase-like pyridoxal phosphate-dependent protein
VTLYELPTPFLTVDLDAVERNIVRTQAYCDRHGLALRPHVKTHKLPLIARMQVDAGARGLTCQKLGEAEVMVDHGFEDILITFPLVGTGKPNRLAELATRARLAIAADSAVVARGLSDAVAARGASIGFLVECDTGYGRTGVQSPEEAAELASVVDALPGLELAGVMTHPAIRGSGEWLSRARGAIERRGLRVERVSGGGTPQAYAAHESGVYTELRVGTYVYGDRRCVVLGLMPLEDCALRVVATVVSRPTAERAIVDAGSKTLTSDPLPGIPDGTGHGLVVEYPDAALERLSEEHGNLDLTACSARPEVGEVVTIVPNHACGVVNLHDEAALHRSRAEVTVVPIPARGLVR